MDLKEDAILGKQIDTHWYYLAKGRAMRTFLGREKFHALLDVGAGSGIFAKQMLEHGRCDTAVCVDPNYTWTGDQHHYGKKISFVRSVDETVYPLIVMMDVLEHVPDDTQLLREYSARMAPHGKIFITVPAFMFIFSGHDLFLEHYRRYTLHSLEQAVVKAGLVPLKTRYYFASLFPLSASVRFTKNLLLKKQLLEPHSELRLYPRWLNRLLLAIHDLERWTIFPMNRIFGLSVFCLCGREDDSKPA